MDAHEIQNLSALVGDTIRADDSIGKLFDAAVRDPAIIFGHISGCSLESGLNCNCSFARMNYNELSALSGVAHSGLDGQIMVLARSQKCKPNCLSRKIGYFVTYLRSSGC